MTTTGVHIPVLLLPKKEIDLTKWAVVACDQFTSQPEYWKEVEDLVGDAPSTLRLIFPEVYLGQDDQSRIARIQGTMHSYLKDGILEEERGFLLVRRTTQGPHGPRTRSGLLACIDLEEYDYHKGSTSLIRPTEGTILDRLPPRIRIREGAPLELPHVMLLIDDPERTVIEPLVARLGELSMRYDVELMQGGGHLTGYTVDARGEAEALAALQSLASPEVFARKYQQPPDTPLLLFAVGDGNHSLATARAVWEKIKTSTGDLSHPARYALVEIVNLHDEGLEFEPIHRVLFDVKKDFLAWLKESLKDQVNVTPCTPEEAFARVGGGETHRVAFVQSEGAGVITFQNPSQNLPVATLQQLLDSFLAEGGAHSIDYVHGTDALYELGARPKNLGFFLPPMPKSDLFKTVILDGALPRKTFSMGEAFEKRYYLECRRILP